MIIHDPSDEDVKLVMCQLDTETIQFDSVAERCYWGVPRVILLNPRRTDGDEGNASSFDYRALSNIMWLTCPYLNEEIHALESRGLIDSIQNFISGDRHLTTMMNDAHAHYYYLRKRLFEKYFGPVMPVDANEIFHTGIGGIKETEFIKCLHIHYTHYRICQDNVVGRIVHHLLDGKINCRTARCRECQV